MLVGADVGHTMKQLITSLIVCSIIVGCHCTTVVEVPVLQATQVLPTYPKKMSEEEAANLLELKLPIAVVSFCGFDDGGTVEGCIYDATGKYIGFRRSPWAFEDRPIEFFMRFYKGRGFDEVRKLNLETKENKMAQDDARLKAFSVLCLGWVDSHFTKKEIRRIREGQDVSNNGNSAGEILWLFRPE